MGVSQGQPGSRMDGTHPRQDLAPEHKPRSGGEMGSFTHPLPASPQNAGQSPSRAGRRHLLTINQPRLMRKAALSLTCQNTHPAPRPPGFLLGSLPPTRPRPPRAPGLVAEPTRSPLCLLRSPVNQAMPHKLQLAGRSFPSAIIKPWHLRLGKR